MKTFEQIYSELAPQLAELELLRQQQYRKAKTWLGITIGMGVLTVLTFAGIRHPVAPVVGGLITAAIYFQGYQPKVKRYKSEFKGKIFNGIIHAVNPCLVYNESHHITKDKFYQSKIFSGRADHYSGEDHISGMVDKTEVEFSELNVQEKRRGSKGRTYYVVIFRGLFMIADFHKDFLGHTIVLPDTAEKLFGFLGKTLQSWNFSR